MTRGMKDRLESFWMGRGVFMLELCRPGGMLESASLHISNGPVMPKWDLNLTLDDVPAMPVFLRIARAISNEVRRGRLRPGDPLPGSRTLAQALQVHRNTVVASYAELVQEGWIETRRAGGTFISRVLPDR